MLDDRKRWPKYLKKISRFLENHEGRYVCWIKKYHSAALSLSQMLHNFWNKCIVIILYILFNFSVSFINANISLTNNLVFILEKVAGQQTSKRFSICKFGKWLCASGKQLSVSSSWMCQEYSLLQGVLYLCRTMPKSILCHNAVFEKSPEMLRANLENLASKKQQSPIKKNIYCLNNLT